MITLGLNIFHGDAAACIFKNGKFQYAQKGTPPVIAKKVSPSSTCDGSPLTGSPSKMSSWNNCKGTFTYSNGNKYLGEWTGGKKNGHGILIYADRTLYIGKWMSDKRHGQGTYTTSNGTVNKGMWESGKFRTSN